jgi:hypothetical protein
VKGGKYHTIVEVATYTLAVLATDLPILQDQYEQPGYGAHLT